MSKYPNYLYHYTSIDSFVSIYKSLTIRLYNITQQSDPKELYETGNKFLRYLYNETLTEDFRNNKTIFNGLKLGLFFYLYKYYSNDEELNQIIGNMIYKIKAGFYKELIENLENRDFYFFISCFTKDKNNDYLWKNYADKYNGIVFKIPLNIIDKNKYGIKNVLYFNDLLSDYLVEIIGNKNNKFMKIDKFIEEIISNMLRIKNIKYQDENEIRIIRYYDSNYKNYEIYNDNNNRIYCELKPNKMLFKSSLKNIYYHENIDESNYKKLMKVSKELKLNLIKHNEKGKNGTII